MALDLFAGVRVSDYAAARPWYERLLGSEPSFIPHATEAVWELAEHRFLFVVEGEDAGKALHTIFVDDLDAFVAEIGSRGIEPDERETYSNGVRKAIYRDADGNEIGFGGPPVGGDGAASVKGDRQAPTSASASAPSREEAWELFCEWTGSESLRRHVLGVEAAMRAYARKYGEDEELWGVTGILHDLDYERHPDLETGHPRVALRLFEEKDYPRELIDAVAGHATYLGVPRETRLAKTLFAVDELTGFIAAVAMVRPTGIAGMKSKSVRKKLKEASFAAAVDREEMREAVAALDEDFDAHVAFVIAALEPHAAELGLTGSGRD